MPDDFLPPPYHEQRIRTPRPEMGRNRKTTHPMGKPQSATQLPDFQTVRVAFSDQPMATPTDPSQSGQRGSLPSFHLPYQPLLPGLNLVATPIGNLADITLRALMALAGADVIYCEDTRQTGKLLQAYNLKKPLRIYNDHANDGQRRDVLRRLEDGNKVVLVSDAGLPLISDPGYKLVAAVVEAGHPVYTYPGASACLTALVGSGLPTDRFYFAGFLPNKDKARRDALGFLSTLPDTLILYESPRRIAPTAAAALETMGNRPCCIARELTKRYETYWRGDLSSLVDYTKEHVFQGECVMLIKGRDCEYAERGDPLHPDWEEALLRCLSSMTLKDAVTFIAKEYNQPRQSVYALALKHRDSLPSSSK